MKPKHVLVLGGLLAGLTTAALTAAQEPAPARTTDQQKLKDRVDALESRQKADEEKADRAAFEKDRIEQIQQHFEAYYGKAHTTEMRVLEAIVAILTLFVAFAALFGFSVFEQRVQHAVGRATTNLETKFREKLAEELETLKNLNTVRLNQIEDGVNCRTYYNFYFAQGEAAGADGRPGEALDSFRRALKTYKSCKNRGVFAPANGGRVLRHIFATMQKLHKDKFTDEAQKELNDKLYDDLKHELALAALEVNGLSPLVRERMAAQHAPEETHPTTAADTTAHSPGPLQVFRKGKQIGEIEGSDTFRCGGQIPSTPPLEVLCERCAKERGYHW